MTVPTRGRLERDALRDIWTPEATEFTPWLALPDNLAVPGEPLCARPRAGPFVVALADAGRGPHSVARQFGAIDSSSGRLTAPIHPAVFAAVTLAKLPAVRFADYAPTIRTAAQASQP